MLSMMYPFFWSQRVYPLCPVSVVDDIKSCSSFLIGIETANVHHFEDIPDIVRFDLDAGIFVQSLMAPIKPISDGNNFVGLNTSSISGSVLSSLSSLEKSRGINLNKVKQFVARAHTKGMEAAENFDADPGYKLLSELSFLSESMKARKPLAYDDFEFVSALSLFCLLFLFLFAL
jgi:hypothetical protein